MKDHYLTPDRAGRELLANCFAAVRPDQEWFKFFREGVEKVTGNVEEYAQDARHSLTLQAARRIAQEESFGETALVRQLNMAEILRRAEEMQLREVEERETALEDERAAAERRIKEIRDDAERGRQQELAEAAAKHKTELTGAVAQAELSTEKRLKLEREARTEALAKKVLLLMKMSALLLFILTSAIAATLQWNGDQSGLLIVLVGILLAVNVVSFLDLLKVGAVEGWFVRVEKNIAAWLAELL